MSGGVASVEAGGAERRSINLIISVESQIGGISRQELSVKAADVKTSGNPTHPAAHYFYKLAFRFQSAEIILVFLTSEMRLSVVQISRETRCLAHRHFG